MFDQPNKCADNLKSIGVHRENTKVFHETQKNLCWWGVFSSRQGKEDSPVERVFILGVVENFAHAGVSVQKLPLNVRRVDRLHQQLRLQFL